MVKGISRALTKHGIGGLAKICVRLAFPVRFNAYRMCKHFFRNRVGLEIGGPSPMFMRGGAFPVYGVAGQIDNCNFDRQTIWTGPIEEGAAFRFDKWRKPGMQYCAEATDLSRFDNEIYDFVLSSHVLEHIANPLQALTEWVRVLKEYGLLLLIVPHKDGTFDHLRPVTSMEHIVGDYSCRTQEDDLTHLEEILDLHDLARDPEAGDFNAFQSRSKRNAEMRGLHHHVFDTRLAANIIDYMGLRILSVEFLGPCHILVAAHKPRRGEEVNNSGVISTLAR